MEYVQKLKDNWVAAAIAVGVIVIANVVRKKLSYKHRRVEAVPTSGNPADALTIYTAGRLAPGVYSASSFCTKLGLFARMAGIPHSIGRADFRSAPKGKIPYVTHGDKKFGDSELVMRYLTNTYLATPAGKSLLVKPVGGAPVLTPFGALTPDQQAISTLVTRICDEHVYWGLVYYAWIVEGPNWRITDEKVLGFIPTFIRRLLTPSMRRGVSTSIMGHGLGRHSESDIIYLVDRDLAALSTILGDKPFVTGSAPCDGDCSLFAIINGLVDTPRQHPLVDAVKKYPNLLAYNERIRHAYFADFEGNTTEAWKLPAAGAGAASPITKSS